MGFAAVVSVCDEPVIGSLGSGVVRWSREQTAALVAAEPALAGELAERGGHVPLLRLPFPGGPVEIPQGFDTLVRLRSAMRAGRRPSGRCSGRPVPRC
nr:hypothetical protein GCM10020093_066460 [Planobispora longispora]